MTAQDRINAVTASAATAKKSVQVAMTDDRTIAAIARVHPAIAMLGPEAQRAAALRLAMIAVATAKRNSTLAACDPASIVVGVVEAAQLGLSVDGVLGQAYLVPYKGHAQMQIGYRGYIALAHASGKVQRITAASIHEADDFAYQEGSSPHLRHSAPLRGSRGPRIGAYALCHLVGASLPMFRVMGLEELAEHRARSVSYARNKDHSPWTTDPGAMEQKTAIRMLAKMLPVSVLQYAAAKDEGHDTGTMTPPTSVDDVSDLAIDGHSEEEFKAAIAAEEDAERGGQ